MQGEVAQLDGWRSEGELVLFFNDLDAPLGARLGFDKGEAEGAVETCCGGEGADGPEEDGFIGSVAGEFDGFMEKTAAETCAAGGGDDEEPS